MNFSLSQRKGSKSKFRVKMGSKSHFLAPASLILYFLFFTIPIHSGRFHKLIIWNVGQGQWLTVATDNQCHHVDMGGERIDLKWPQDLCRNLKNDLYLSHSDQDHIQFMKWGQRHLPELCLHALPREKLNKYKNRILTSVPICSTKKNTDRVHELKFQIQSPLANDLSRVHLVASELNPMIIPGDSTIQAENIWLNSVKFNKLKIKVLVLGHHGSITSTGENLLGQLPNLKMALASARYRRYRHPNSTVVNKLKKRGIPTITTEDWGHIVLDIE